ncbi:hypothetical protein Ahy_B04g071912 [Arachis hypogaea]|uniref:Transposase MuDR plant domain-containing protein n=1 Tax=Arachis hypogaea TaxID=3818 RepID=A0A444ZLY7_ARAHY|nr:hypothetical protein Ahy_B04g071912 [Arachis hypogaea]
MNDRVVLKVCYYGQILLQKVERVKFVCENSLDIVIPFTLSFEELKCVICGKIDSQMSKRVPCILYKYFISVFGRFIQFQTKYVTDETSMQEMFSMYIESRSQIDSEEEFENNYEIVGPDENEDQADGTIEVEVANTLANQHLFEKLSFMHVLDLEAMHAPQFPKYMNAAEHPIVTDGEFVVGMEFSSRKTIIMVMKDYTIHRGVDYRVYESKLMTFYAKCTQVSIIRRKYYWVLRRYNGSHTCTRATIFQDHSKLDSNTIADAIKPLVEADSSIKMKSVIAKVQSNFNYTISYRKAWLAKLKSVKKFLEVGKHLTKLCPYGLRLCITKSHQLLSILKLYLHIRVMTW